ncbi:MAG: peptidoglycan editing factor PgeF [Candidatus Firestonebacteria bacterium]
MQKVLIFHKKNNILCFTSIKPLNFKGKFLKENIKKLLAELKINPKKIIFGKQIHSNKVLIVENKAVKNSQEVDGFITNQKNVLLCVFTADCIPVFIHNRVTGCIGLVHCGWKGIYKEIIKNAIKKLIKNYSVQPKNLNLILGPSIKKCCYEVSKDLADKFKKKFGNARESERSEKSKERYYIGLDEIVKHQILKFKIPKKNVRIINECTSCKKGKYFSYRRDGKRTGRMLSGIIMGIVKSNMKEL